VRFNYMSIMFRKSLFVLILLVSVNFVAKAQFLGQQSLSQSSYVIDQSGQLWAWGDNFYGQLGVGDRVNRNTPTLVPLPPGASKWLLVSGGENFAVAVTDDNTLYAWGLNDKGQIGIGTADNGIYPFPMRIQNPPLFYSYWKWVSAGADHVEALTNDGELFAWGNNSNGQLGIGNTENVTTPQMVVLPTGLSGWADVAAGPGYTLIISLEGLLYGCGKDSLGTFTPSSTPKLARIDAFRAYSPLPCLAASYKFESRIDQQYLELSAYAIFDIGPTGGSPESLASVADGGQHSLLLWDDGNVDAAGDNSHGQLGLGPTDSHAIFGTLKFPTGVTQFVAVAAGLHHSLAIGNDGWLYAWGDNSVGELGIGNTKNQLLPVKVLNVCPPLEMTASLTIPSNFSKPYAITLTLKNKSTTSAITNAGAYLVLTNPLINSDSTPLEPVPSPIASGNSSTIKWDGSLVPIGLNSTLNPIYFAYLQAKGSAPLLVPVSVQPIPPSPWVFCDGANVEDSLTFAPLAGVELVFPGPPPGVSLTESPFDSNKMISNQEGVFSFCLKGPVYDNINYPNPVSEYPVNLMKENYRTTMNTISEPKQEDLTFYLGPSDIQGTFAMPSLSDIYDSLEKVYYPDSLIGFAISQRGIFRTLDSGINWVKVYQADTNIHDVKFVDPGEGFVVGDGGEILSTMDTGKTWQSIHAGNKDLRALATINPDTAWAVGDTGALVMRTASGWSLQPKLSTRNLTCIHFLDPDDGVIGANGAYYIYNTGTWIPYSIGMNIRSVFYCAPGLMNFVGTNGNILNYDDTGFFPLLSFDSTYTKQTINSLYFLNPNVGYAAGDSGASFVTYDGGESWATMPEFPRTATSMNFFSLAGHGVTDSGVLNYTGAPDEFKSIVRGRITFGDPAIPILGAEIDRYYVALNDTDTVSAFIDNAFTNEQGNFVFTGVDAVFPYEYHFNFTDSGNAKTVIFYAVKGVKHQIITLNYNDYTPLPPDTTVEAVNSLPPSELSLNVNAIGSEVQVSYSIPVEGPARIIMQDILGRTVKTISDGFSTAGSHETDVPLDGLPNGAYYVTLTAGEGAITKKFVLLQ
jgi:alpha-tubulin suppressor-like RCC1 family protein/photosystem II stability/assembly factor-like uncharacterized protein